MRGCIEVTLRKGALQGQGIHLHDAACHGRLSKDTGTCDIMRLRRKSPVQEQLPAGLHQTGVLVVYIVAEKPGPNALGGKIKTFFAEFPVITAQDLTGLDVRIGPRGGKTGAEQPLGVAVRETGKPLPHMQLRPFRHHDPGCYGSAVQRRLHNEGNSSGQIRKLLPLGLMGEEEAHEGTPTGMQQGRCLLQ